MATDIAGEYLNSRQRDELLRAQLYNDRSTFVASWRDSGDFILPRRPRFFVTDANKGDRRNQKIIDSTGTQAARTLQSGMMAGVTSPARPWFHLTTPDPDMADFGPVKDWLSIVGDRMSSVFLRSNLYNVLPILYGDMGVFGTGCVFEEEDFDGIVRFYSFPIGAYMIANDERGKVNIFVRDFRMTVRQLVSKFGRKDPVTGQIKDWSNFSMTVQNLWEKGNTEAWVDICHIVKPNEFYNPKKLDSKFKKFSSRYYERGMVGNGTNATYNNPGDDTVYLRESGYNRFPALAGRWGVTGEDVYGTSCPGIDAIGDIKALQTMQKRKAEAIEKMVRPPMQGPPELKNQKASILPGDITYVATREGSQGFRPSMTVDARIQELLMDIKDHQGRVDSAFYKDIFLMFEQDDRSGTTATEINEKKQEKLLALGPMLEQLNQDVLDPVIDSTFDLMMIRSVDARGQFIDGAIIPKPPPELQGISLRVEYVSVMAQAQKLLGVEGLERFSGFVQNVAQYDQSAADNLNIDNLITHYGGSVGIPTDIIRPADQVQAIRTQRQKQQQMAQAQQQTQTLAQGASAAKDLSDTDVSPGSGNALSALLQQANAGKFAPTP